MRHTRSKGASKEAYSAKASLGADSARTRAELHKHVRWEEGGDCQGLDFRIGVLGGWAWRDRQRRSRYHFLHLGSAFKKILLLLLAGGFHLILVNAPFLLLRDVVLVPSH